MPVKRAVRVIALNLLAGATDTARQLRKHPANAEALHAFRIATRRLRSWLRTWRPVLRDRVRPRDERRLRRIASATGRARDLDVHLNWLDDRHARGKARAALTALRAEVKTQRKAARRDVAAAAAELLARDDQLQGRFAVYHEDVRDVAAQDALFGHELARMAREAAEELRERIGAVTSRDDADAIHAVRIAAKRLRYLLEPVQDLVGHSGPLLKALQSLQDEAGSFHDAHVLSQTLSTVTSGATGNSKLARRLNAKMRTSYAALETHWLGRASTPFFARVRRLTAALVSKPA